MGVHVYMPSTNFHYGPLYLHSQTAKTNILPWSYGVSPLTGVTVQLTIYTASTVKYHLLIAQSFRAPVCDVNRSYN